MKEDQDLPRGADDPAGLCISIITPSYNQGQFIQQTIESVLNQGWPTLEYLIFDGGSSDNSVEVIKKFESRLTYWQSGPDGGQAAAVNAGFDRVRGDLIGWQNSDDYYHGGALIAAARAAETHPEIDVFYGDKDYVDVDGNFLFTAWAKDPHDFCNMIPWPCVNTEVMFFRRRVLDEGFRLKENLRHYMDYDFFWQLLLAGKKFMHVPGIRAGFRQHPHAKTSRQGEIAQREAFDIYLNIWKSGRSDEKLQEVLIKSLQNECLNDFHALRMGLFRSHLASLSKYVGRHAISSDLRKLWAFSFLPAWVIILGKRIRRMIVP